MNHDAQFRVSLGQAQNIDRESGMIRGLSVMTIGEALGHGVDIDAKTLEQVAEAMSKPVKAYLKHAGFENHAATDVVGYFGNVKMDGNKVRADFEALGAFREHAPREFGTLFEVADKHSESIGLSIDARGYAALAWKMEDGSELIARWYDDKPEGATSDKPVLRVAGLNSVDFVDMPAANPSGLFSKQPEKAENNNNTQKQMNETIKKLSERFGKEPEALAQAVGLLAAKPEAAFESIESEVVASQKEAAFEAMKTENQELKDEVEQLGKKLEELEAEKKQALEKLEKESAEFKAKLEKMGKFHVDHSNGDTGNKPQEPQLSARERAAAALTAKLAGK